MSKIISASPLGFNIKTKTGIIFAGVKLFPPFAKNILFDIEENPHRWSIEYEKENTEKIESPLLDIIDAAKKENVVKIENPSLEKSDTVTSEAATKAKMQSAAKRKKIATK